jgi:hypothetical protein
LAVLASATVVAVAAGIGSGAGGGVGLEGQGVNHIVPCSQWASAVPVAAKLSKEKNISYEPEFSPQYEHAYEYMAPSYVLAEAVKVYSKDQALPAVATEDEGGAVVEGGGTDSEDAYSESDSELDLTLEARYSYARSKRSI